MSIWLRVAGYPATEIAAHTPPTWETWADGGSGSLSWAFALTMRSQHQALRPGALVELMLGPMPLWSGLMTDPDRTTWECTAYGHAAAAKGYLALDGGGASTRELAAATTQAIARGWQVANPAGLSGTVSGDTTGNPITVAQLWDEYAEQTGQRWGVNGRRSLYLRADPTAPMWLASPGAAAFGTTSEDVAGTLMGRYLDSTTGLYATVTAGSGTPEKDVDLSDREAMTAAQATAILNGMLTRGGDRAWTNGVTLSRDQLQTMGGTPAFLPAVRGGQLMRSFGLANAVNALALDTVIGKTRYDLATPDLIYVEPTNTVPRNAVDVWAA